MDIYAPLAERIGMYEFMTEMQTLAFRELEPDAYRSITKRLERLHQGGGGDLIQRIGRGIQAISRRTASRPRSRAARSIPSRSGARWPSATSASSNCPTSWPSALHRRLGRRMLPRSA